MHTGKVSACAHSHILYACTFPPTAVSVGFQSLEFLSTEGTGATVGVCLQIFAGTLERTVSAFITTSEDTATGKLPTGNEIMKRLSSPHTCATTYMHMHDIQRI